MKDWPEPPVRRGRPDTRPVGDRFLQSVPAVESMFLKQLVADIADEVEGKREFDLGYETIEEFASRRLWIVDKLARLVPFRLNGVQQRVMRIKREAVARGKPAKFLVLKYRRCGISTLEQALSYQMAVSNHNAQVVTLAHTAQDTSKLFRIPSLMKQKDELAPSSPKRGNRYVIEFPTLNSSFYCGTAGSAGFGRGQTLQRVHGSEVAYWLERSSHQVEEQEQLIVGLTEAASHGEIVLETTPKGEEWFSTTYRQAKKGLNDWTPIFLPWFVDEENRIDLSSEEIVEVVESLTDEERELAEKHGLDAAQIAWRRSKKRSTRLAAQEYPEDDESCFLSSGTSFFDVTRMLDLLRQVSDYERKHVAGGYLVEWEQPEEGVSYVIGADTSEGIPGCDPNGYGVMRRDNGAQVASLHGLFRPDVLATKLAEAHRKWNRALVGVERENHGHAVILKLKDLGLRHPRWVYHFRKDRPGWSTNSETRPVMLDELATYLDEAEAGKQIRDRDLIGECLTFRMQSSGKFEHDSGAHDDCVFKWAIARQMRKVRSRAPTMI